MEDWANPAGKGRVRPILHIAIVLHICLRLNATPSKSVAFNLGKVHLLLNFTYGIPVLGI